LNYAKYYLIRKEKVFTLPVRQRIDDKSTKSRMIRIENAVMPPWKMKCVARISLEEYKAKTFYFRKEVLEDGVYYVQQITGKKKKNYFIEKFFIKNSNSNKTISIFKRDNRNWVPVKEMYL